MQAGCAIRLKDSFKPPLADQSLFGQLEEIVNPGVLKVNLMMRDGHQFKLGSEAELVTVPAVEVAEHHNITNLESIGSHRRAWKALGLRLAKVSDTSEDVFVPIKGLPASAQVLVGDYDSEEEDELERQEEESRKRRRPGLQGYDSDDGFVVDDDEEVFTTADPDESEFVAETHEAVNQYNDWVPVTDEEKKFRTWMDDFERRVAHKDDDAQFARGTHVNHARPPRRKRRKRSESH